jgi:pimeloyl-ACP methyl ester carboxylesterase
MKLVLGAALAALAVGAALALGPEATSAEPRTVTWHNCPEQQDAPPGAQSGVVRVPVNWSRPDGEKLDIAIVRRRATDTGHRLGTLIFLPGGPGQSGVDAVASTDKLGGSERRFDLVSLDPRGVGRSSAVKCSTKLVLQAVREPVRTSAQFARMKKHSALLGKDCARHSGPVLRHLDAVSAAKDVEAVRAALGERRVTLYGHSYGTLYALKYAELFGSHVRAAVLDGVMDPSIRRREFTATAARSLEQSFGQFADWCRTSSSCLLHKQDTWQVYDRLAVKARAGTLHNAAHPDRPVTLAEFNGELDGMLLTPSWPVIDSYLSALDTGEPWGEDEDDTPKEKTVDYADPAVCADYRLSAPGFPAYAADQRASLRAAPHFGYSPNSLSYVNLCTGFPLRPAHPPTSSHVHTRTPLLLINSRYDNATPIDWARSVQSRLGRAASLVEVDGWGHGMKIFNPGAEQRTVLRYLTDLRVPRSGTVIPGSRPPGIPG